jgi:hypothetical protein
MLLGHVVLFWFFVPCADAVRQGLDGMSHMRVRFQCCCCC